MRDWVASAPDARRRSDDPDPEGAALLNWFADGAMTLLGYHVEKPYEVPLARSAFSAFRVLRPTRAARRAMRHFEKGGEVPLMAKAERQATVHRRVPLDLVVVPVMAGDTITGIGPTPASDQRGAARPPESVPVLRARLQQLDADG